MKQNSQPLRSFLAPAFLALGLLASANAHAQALNTAGKGADIFVFGGYNYTVPDYGPDGVNNTGLILGGDYTRYFGWALGGYNIDPSLEIRATDVSGQVVKERTGMAGLRLHTTVKDRFHPYIDLLIGLGVIDYQPPLGYPRDHGLAYSLGGGVDIDLVHHFQLKLDYQEQSWNLGVNAQQVPNGGNFTLSPQALTIGVSYHIPFSSDVGASPHSNKPPKETAPRPTPQSAATVPSSTATPEATTSAPTAPTPTDSTPPAAPPADTTPAPTAGTSTPAPTNP